jgi:hypothetical protein
VTFVGCCADAGEQSTRSEAVSAKPMTVVLMGFLPVFFFLFAF